MADTLSDGFHDRVAAALALPTAANGDSFQARLTLATAAVAAGVRASPDGFVERLILTGLIGSNVTSTALLGFSAQNIDGTNNSSLVDTQALGTWIDLGTVGAVGNAVQATAGSKPAFSLAGGPAGKSAVQCVDSSRFMTTGTFTLIPQPFTIVAIHRNTKAATQVYFGATPPLSEMYSTAAAGNDHLNFGADVDTGLAASANQYHLRLAVANGASSFLRLDGVQSANINAGTSGFGTTATLMRDASGSLGIIGLAAEFWLWAGVPGVGAPSVASIEAYFNSLYTGGFPQ